MKCEVLMSVGRYSHLDTTVCWLPKVRYDLLIPNLSAEEFKQRDAELQPLRDFITEWLIPFDVKCDIVVKWHNLPPLTNQNLVLDYNSELKV